MSCRPRRRPADCAAIVTGDQELVVLDPFRDICILTPSEFWTSESEQDA
jgi:predicted nucleic acid-binding protein